MQTSLTARIDRANSSGQTKIGYFSIFSTLTSLFLISSMACKASQTISNGSEVKINYTLKVDGAVVDSSVGKQPLPYLAGSGQIIPGLDEQLIGLKKGDKKEVVVTPEKGYGQLNPKAIQKIPIAKFGDTKGLKVGSVVRGQSGGRPIQAKVLEIGNKEITLDMNHPLAGKTLNFSIEVMDVQPGKKVPAAK